jgi:hypothetical protein
MMRREHCSAENPDRCAVQSTGDGIFAIFGAPVAHADYRSGGFVLHLFKMPAAENSSSAQATIVIPPRGSDTRQLGTGGIDARPASVARAARVG